MFWTLSPPLKGYPSYGVWPILCLKCCCWWSAAQSAIANLSAVTLFWVSGSGIIVDLLNDLSDRFYAR
jgi:hypothetical protein